MKSGRQRRVEIRARRLARSTVEARLSYTPWAPERIPMGALKADPSKLLHDNTYGPRPRFYVDRSFTCIDCGKSEVWKAADQKWWYEDAKGKIDSRANRCLPCRRVRRLKRSQERRVHIEGLIAKCGLDRAAERLGWSTDKVREALARWEATE